jgi:hypothetical protein
MPLVAARYPGMDEPKPKKRRWFRFSLRTMFLLVTVGCIWLGWQASVVIGRNSVRRRAEQQGAIFCPWPSIASPNPSGHSRLSFIRILMGDANIKTILFEFGSDAQAKTYQDCESQFPEADKLFYPPEQRQQFRQQIEMGVIPKVDIEPVVR